MEWPVRMQEPKSHERPIGFWIKAADRLLDDAIDALHARADFTRRRWQVLNAVARQGPCAPERIVEALHPMLCPDEITSELKVLADMRMVEISADRTTLTETGRGRLEALVRRQDGLRRRAVEGIDAEAYATTLSTLARIVANLSGLSGEPSGSGSRIRDANSRES